MSGAREVGLRELSRIRERLDSLFEEGLLGSSAPAPVRESWSPPVDVAETDSAFHLTFELPGVRHEEVDLHLEGQRLVLAGHRSGEADGKRYLRLERSYGRFHREVDLGSALKAEGIEAELRRGVLTVRVAKRQPRNIEIRSRE